MLPNKYFYFIFSGINVLDSKSELEKALDRYYTVYNEYTL